MSTDVQELVDIDEISDGDTELNEREELDTTEGTDEGELKVTYPQEGVIIEKNDRSLSEFHRWYKQGRLIIEPEWQRSYVWDKRRASKLIESFLVDIPVPVIYLAKNETSKYEVIDGVQRLTSIFDFFDGQFALSGLEMLPEMNKKKFSELPQEKQNKLLDATLRTFELSPQTSKNLLNDRLAKVMDTALPQDTQRLFSQALKKEMYQQNSVCAICNQQIKTIGDAALDHEELYWRGGQTVPTNARLVHRLCNMKRPR